MASSENRQKKSDYLRKYMNKKCIQAFIAVFRNHVNGTVVGLLRHSIREGNSEFMCIHCINGTAHQYIYCLPLHFSILQV
jgi:hypothetical protein